MASHLLCRLEITTDEQRDEYMHVHMATLKQERAEAEAAIYAAAAEINPDEIETEAKEEQV